LERKVAVAESSAEEKLKLDPACNVTGRDRFSYILVHDRLSAIASRSLMDLTASSAE
jgi:hypothetical protein